DDRQRRRGDGHDPRAALRGSAQLRAVALEGRCRLHLAVDEDFPRGGQEQTRRRGGAAGHRRGARGARVSRSPLLGGVHAGRPMTATALWDDAIGRLRSLGAQWATFTLIGSFILYVLGYLTIRFHLTVLGAGTDLSIVDERYLFAGARFVVYLVSACVTLLLLLLLPAAIAWAAWRFLWRRGKRQGEAAPARSLSRDTRFNQTAL